MRPLSFPFQLYRKVMAASSMLTGTNARCHTEGLHPGRMYGVASRKTASSKKVSGVTLLSVRRLLTAISRASSRW